MSAVDLVNNPYCRRDFERFTITDQRVWVCKIEGKRLPIEWMQNLSHSGMSIRYKKYKSYSIGDVVNIKLRHMGRTVFKARGIVCWEHSNSSDLNMSTFGIKFDEVECDDIYETTAFNKFSNSLEAYEDSYLKLVADKKNELKNEQTEKKFNEAAIFAMMFIFPFLFGCFIEIILR